MLESVYMFLDEYVELAERTSSELVQQEGDIHTNIDQIQMKMDAISLQMRNQIRIVEEIYKSCILLSISTSLGNFEIFLISPLPSHMIL